MPEVSGFRRGLTPYVEMGKLTAGDGAIHRAYGRWVQYGIAMLVTAAGLFWLLN